jgi:glycine/D-amino acid oxidase-like deaminating enzyme/nitrite reductase/ring-hydroxylating ferredoxin subunit
MNDSIPSVDADQTSGYHKTYWLESEPQFDSPPLSSSITTDVVVIGAGIAGLSSALRLLEEGLKVVVIEDGLVGSGESGRTTAHITPALDDRYYYLANRFGKDKAKLAAESHWAALQWIEQTINKYQINCNFRKVDGYLFTHESDKNSNLDRELDACQQAGLLVEMVQHVPGIAGVNRAIRFSGHGQFHIMKYLNGLCEAITKAGGSIYCHSRAAEISEGQVKANGHTIQAKHVVVATNTPVNDLVTMHTKQFPYRTYVVGALIARREITPALWWDTGNQNKKSQPYHYVRLEEYDNEHYLLIAGGEDHKTGQADNEGILEEDRYVKLEQWVREYFPKAGQVIYRWSGQVMEPLDGMAFIGKNPGNEQVYIITGDSGNGMTHGTIGGMLVADLVKDRHNPWAEIYDPSRLMWRSPLDFVSESLNMAAQYADYFSRSELDTIYQLGTEQGAIINSGIKKYAIYRDENSAFHAFSAICPHLGCILQWNQDERSFDCPCHGSRFSCQGKLMNGPAITDLKKIEEEDFTKKKIQ